MVVRDCFGWLMFYFLNLRCMRIEIELFWNIDYGDYLKKLIGVLGDKVYFFKEVWLCIM